MSEEKKYTKDEIVHILNQFTGTNNYYRSSSFTNHIVHTDGVQFLANTAGASWLIDLIVSWQLKAKVRQEPFQVWTLKKEPKRESKEARIEREAAGEPAPMVWVAKATDGGRGEKPKVIARQEIPYSDFPLDEITLFMERGSLDGVTTKLILMLPSER